MMGDSYCPFPERLSAQFTEIDSDVMMSLSESNPVICGIKRPDGRFEAPKSLYYHIDGGRWGTSSFHGGA